MNFIDVNASPSMTDMVLHQFVKLLCVQPNIVDGNIQRRIGFGLVLPKVLKKHCRLADAARSVKSDYSRVPVDLVKKIAVK